MCIKKLIVLLLLELLVKGAVMEDIPSVLVVSTTQRTSNTNEDERKDKISKLEEKLALQTERMDLTEEKLELHTRLTTMELQKMQAEISNSLTNVTNHFQSKLEEKLALQREDIDRLESLIKDKSDLGTRLTETAIIGDGLQSKLDLQVELIKSEFNLKLNRLEEQVRITQVPRNCKELQTMGGNTNIYYIKPKPAAEAFLVLCDMETRGGGWTYVMNRFDGSQNFNLEWTDYKGGFGNLTGEFWLGLEYLHYLTESEINELLIELVDWDGKTIYAHYNDFTIGNENSGYYLKILSRFSGNTGDAFGKHVGRKFSTVDRDTINKCADFFHGGWWYGDCYYAYLTGPYKKRGPIPEDERNDGIKWSGYSQRYSMKQARMMIRPRDGSIAFTLPHKN